MSVAARFSVVPTPLAGLQIVERRPIGDRRGQLTRLFCASELSAAGWPGPVAQINQTRTARRGTARGLHFQYPPHAEFKMVTCLQGEVYDVAVDLRRDSATFLQWHGQILSAENNRAMLIPAGFAHGLQALSDDCDLLYVHSRAYASRAEGALNLRDPRLAIQWPLPLADLSERDAAHPFINADFAGI